VVRAAKPAAWLAVVLLVAVAVGGCGGSSSKSSNGKVTPEAYVNQICSSVGDWLRAVVNGSAQIGKELTPGSTPAHAKQALETLMHNSVADSERVVAGLQAAGTPNVPGGEEIAAELVGSFQQATAALRHVEAQVKSLPTDDKKAFLNGARQVGGAVQSSLASIGTGLSSLRSSQLQRAASKSQACKNLGTA
jgi:hypothetical protein